MLRRLLSNWPNKLGALVAAAILTGYVHGQMNPVVSSTVTAVVRYDHLPDGCVVSLKQHSVPVTVTGSKAEVESVVDSAKSGEVAAWVDLAGLDPGAYSLKLGRISFPEPLPEDVKAHSTVANVSAAIETRTSRTIPIEVKIASTISAGWASGGATISPSMAAVSGASSMVDSVDRLIIAVQPTPSNPKVSEYAAIKAVDAHGVEVKAVKIDPVEAHVSLKLVEAPADRLVFASPNVVGQPQFPYRVTRITVSPSSISVKGRADVLANTGNISTDEVDINGATSDIIRRVSLRVPLGLEVDGPREVRVGVKIELNSGG